MNVCVMCETRLSIDERISHRGKMVCGHCFLKMDSAPEGLVPFEVAKESPEINGLIAQLMEAVVILEERISSIEERLDKLDVQFDSICG